LPFKALYSYPLPKGEQKYPRKKSPLGAQKTLHNYKRSKRTEIDRKKLYITIETISFSLHNYETKSKISSRYKAESTGRNLGTDKK